MALSEVWQTTPNLPNLTVADCMRAVAREFGKPPMSQAKEFLKLGFAPGKLRPDEYFYFRLFEDCYDEGLRRTFVGKRLEESLHQLTCQPGSWIVAHDKLTCYGVLQSLGYPVPRTQAVYRRGAEFPGLTSFGDREALARALRGGLEMPFFGKPARGIRSAGVLSVEGYDAATDELHLVHGNSVGVDDLIGALDEYAEYGYLFQERIRQHPEVSAICGDAVATVRVIVLLTPDGPELYRGLWKVPTGNNVADNFWRDGNVLAALDLESGRVTRAVQGIGPDLSEIEQHPTTGKPLVGVTIPAWPTVRDVVLSASKVFPDLRMQAWDVAIGADGPVLVEVNVGGDYNLPQLATGQGMLTDRFLEFLRDCAGKRGLEPMLKRLKLAK